MRLSSFTVHIFFVISVALLGCGDASVQVAPMDEYERSTEALIFQLSSASAQERQSLLISLTGPRGYRLNWSDFWARLEHSPAAAKTWSENKSELRALAAQNCRVDQYQSLARFIISRGDGWDWLIGPDKICNTALGPELATWLVSYLADHLAKVSAPQLLAFFIFELKSEPNPQKWLPYWNLATEEQLVKTYRSLPNNDSLARMQLRIAFRNVWNRGLQGGIPGVLESFVDLANLFQEKDSVEALEYIVRIATAEDPPKKLSGLIAVEQLTNTVFAKVATLEKHWSHYLLLRNLISHCARNWEMSEQLVHRDQLMKAFVKQVGAAANSNETTFFFRSRLGETWDSATFLELATFAFVSQGADSAFAKEFTLRAWKLGHVSSSIEETLLRLRFEISSASALDKSALVTRFCETLRSVGIRTGTLVRLPDLPTMTSMPGCFVVRNAENASMRTQQEVDLSFFSLVDFQTRELVIHASVFYAGVLQASGEAQVDVRAPELGAAIVVALGNSRLKLLKDK